MCMCLNTMVCLKMEKLKVLLSFFAKILLFLCQECEFSNQNWTQMIMCMCLNTMLMLQNGKAQSIIILFCPKNYFFFAKRVQIPIRIKHKWLLMWVYTHVSKFFWALPKRLAFALPKFIFFNYNQSQSTWNSPSWMKTKISGTCKIFQKLMKKTEKISVLFLGLWKNFNFVSGTLTKIWNSNLGLCQILKKFPKKFTDSEKFFIAHSKLTHRQLALPFADKSFLHHPKCCFSYWTNNFMAHVRARS